MIHFDTSKRSGVVIKEVAKILSCVFKAPFFFNF